MEVKMAENKWGMAILVGIICLLVGGLATYGLFPKTIELKPDKCTPVACNAVPCTPTEIEKEITVPLNAQETYLDVAVADFLDKSLEDLTTCKNIEYDEDQIKVSKVYDDWNVVFSEDKNDNADYTVSFKVKLKYLDSDVEEKCYDTKDVEVYYRQDKSPKITIN